MCRTAKPRHGRQAKKNTAGDIDWDGSPKGLEFRLPHEKKVFRTWTEVWDALAVVALRERGEGKTKVLTPAKRSDADAAPQWRTGEPENDADGWYYCKDPDGFAHLYYRYFDTWFETDHCKHKVDEELYPVAWYPLPKARGDEE